jgi:hypothetical protein
VHNPALENKLIKTGKIWENCTISLFPGKERNMKERKNKIDKNCICKMQKDCSGPLKMQQATGQKFKKMHF